MKITIFTAVALCVFTAIATNAQTSGGRVGKPGESEDRRRTVPRAECFPLGQLPAELHAQSEEMLLKLLDTEALYTLVGGLKPITSVEYNFTANTASNALITREVMTEAEQKRRLLSALRCGDGIYADLHSFTDGKNSRSFDAYVVNIPALRRAVSAHANYFSQYGITSTAHPVEVVLTFADGDIEHDHVRGIGYLFGYPDYAVNFFADGLGKVFRKEAPRPPEAPTEPFEIPTFSRMTLRNGGTRSYFVYAVPKGHQENDEDRAIKVRAAEILAAYRERRARYIGPGKPGAFALLRDWYCDSKGRCSVENVR
jgi:hypothetical protein